MKFTLYGKVLKRTVRKVKKTDGSTYDLYQIDIEEPGQYPSVFQVTTKDASLLGQKDGPFGVGRFVTATGFTNGTTKEAKRTDGTAFTAYRVWFTLSKLEPSGQTSAQPSQPTAADAEEEIPF